jgi:hypothetical protein
MRTVYTGKQWLGMSKKAFLGTLVFWLAVIFGVVLVWTLIDKLRGR